ncbi:hypothetical protein GOP47_0020959 [Adiantum capillus-veneris]|uniref:Uncharacterized protein n=1 Tax=Adiantum capillus-veneris TaxID=13818 RepID=A0A9D4UBR7_ADICA|nr:hypothetical protein GOP47_0020959 [Adiantum capillus-veneris]
MNVKCQGCFSIATVFSHSQTVVLRGNCSTVLCQPRQEAVLDLLKATPSGRRVIKGASYLSIPHLHQESLLGDTATPTSGSWEWMTLPKVGAPSSVTVEDHDTS